MAAKLFSPRKIGVCGSSKELSPEAAQFCRALGRRLASESLAQIISGGTKKREKTPEDDFAADWLIVNSARDAMGPEVEFDRIVTVVRDDQSRTDGFEIGARQRARGKTSEARRIAFVRDLDALIAVGGRGGTDQELALAIEHHIPVLPVPTFSGKAKDFWKAYRSELIRDLRIDEERARRWEEPDSTTPAALDELADDMVEVLFKSLARRCFVIMPFHDDFNELFDGVIEPAVRAAGDEPMRVDRAATPGDVVRQIDDGIQNCEYAIAVLDRLRPNVLYELGVAHGRRKTTILLHRPAPGGEDPMPFDLSTQQRLEYANLDAELSHRLTTLIRSAFDRSTVRHG